MLGRWKASPGPALLMAYWVTLRHDRLCLDVWTATAIRQRYADFWWEQRRLAFPQVPRSAFLIIGSDKKQTAHISLLAMLFRTMPLKRVAAKLGVREKRNISLLLSSSWANRTINQTVVVGPTLTLLFGWQASYLEKAEMWFARAEYVSAGSKRANQSEMSYFYLSIK